MAKAVSQSVHTFKIIISGDKVAEQTSKVLQSLQKDLSLAGFRKGHVPLNIVEKQYDKIMIEYEAQKYALEKAVNEYLKGSELKYYPDSVDISDRKETEAGVEYSCKVEIEPEFDLPVLKKVTGKVDYKIEVGDKEFTDYQEMVKKSYAAWSDPEDKKKITPDTYFRVKINCKEGDHGHLYPKTWFSKAELLDFPGMDVSQLSTLVESSKVSFEATVPDKSTEFELGEFLGKKILFELELLDQKIMTCPEFDDNLAKQLGFKSVEECRVQFMESMKVRGVREAMNKSEEEFLDNQLKHLNFVVPKTVLHRAVMRRQGDISRNLSAKGLNFEEYLKSQDMSFEVWRENEEKEFEPFLKRQILLDRFITSCDYKIDKADVSSLIANYKASGRQLDEVQAEFMIKQEQFFKEYIHGE